jgi:hypothetical protein
MNEESSATPESTPAVPPAPLPPGINIKALKKGTVLLLEGEADIYELIVMYPEHGIVEISSNQPALRQGTVGQFMFSVRWSQPGTRLNLIQQGWAMTLRFRNGEYQTQPIMSSRVSGKCDDGSRWSYDVF